MIFVSPHHLARLIVLEDSGVISHATARYVFEKLWDQNRTRWLSLL